MKIIKNKARCRSCKTVIESISRHHFVTCRCYTNSPNNKGIFIDGGTEYLKRGGHFANFVDMSETKGQLDD